MYLSLTLSGIFPIGLLFQEEWWIPFPLIRTVVSIFNSLILGYWNFFWPTDFIGKDSVFCFVQWYSFIQVDVLSTSATSAPFLIPISAIIWLVLMYFHCDKSASFLISKIRLRTHCFNGRLSLFIHIQRSTSWLSVNLILHLYLSPNRCLTTFPVWVFNNAGSGSALSCDNLNQLGSSKDNLG